MTPSFLLALLDGAIGIIETLAPHVASLLKSENVTPEEQQALLDRIQKLRGLDAFSGPEWQIEP